MEYNKNTIYKLGQTAIFPGDGTELTIAGIDEYGIYTVTYKTSDGETQIQMVPESQLYLYGFPKLSL